MSGLHSLDVGDFDAEDGTLSASHRPDEGTRLKNREDGERVVTLDAETADVVSDYIKYQRVRVENDYGRRPLFCSKYRYFISTLTSSVYGRIRILNPLCETDCGIIPRRVPSIL
jgi:integrase